MRTANEQSLRFVHRLLHLQDLLYEAIDRLTYRSYDALLSLPLRRLLPVLPPLLRPELFDPESLDPERPLPDPEDEPERLLPDDEDPEPERLVDELSDLLDLERSVSELMERPAPIEEPLLPRSLVDEAERPLSEFPDLLESLDLLELLDLFDESELFDEFEERPGTELFLLLLGMVLRSKVVLYMRVL